MPLVNTNDEKSAAAQTNQVEHGTETRPIIQTDSLATSSIIYSALNSAAVGGGGGPVIDGMKLVAQRLSQNSLAPWYKGAVLLVGTPKEITSIYGQQFCETNCALVYNADSWDASAMLPWLTELRRTYGNSWEGCMQVAGFIEQYQAAKIRDEQWSKIPSVSFVDRQNGSVRGWEGINKSSELIE